MKHKRIPRVSINDYDGANLFIDLDSMTPSKIMTKITDTYDLYAPLRHATVISINRRSLGVKDIRDADIDIIVKIPKTTK